MKGKSRKRIELTGRDQKVLAHLFESKVSTLNQLQRDIFRGVSYQATYRRLSKLIDFGYIDAYYIRQYKGALVYKLGPKGITFLSGGDGKFFSKKQFSTHAPVHDLTLVDVKSTLINCQNVERIMLENYLQCMPNEHLDKGHLPFKELNSDGLILLQAEDKIIYMALELELSLKFSKRYRNFFTNYYLESGVDGVLFVAGNNRILRKVQKLEQEVTKNDYNKFFYIELDELLKNKGGHFLNVKGDILKVA